MKIIDLSHHQPEVDFSKLEGVFVIHKCTEGTSFLDPKYNERKDKIQGSYHYANGTDPIEEANWYLKHIGNEDFLALDWEIEHADPVKWCKTFIDQVKEKTGKTCWLYTNDARAMKYKWPEDWWKFWLARYADYTGKYYPGFHPKFKRWILHQYTSRGRIDGVKGNVDLSVSKLNIKLNDMRDEKNYVKLTKALADFVGVNYGDNPSDKESNKILSKLDEKRKELTNVYKKLENLIEAKNEAMQAVERQHETIDELEQRISNTANTKIKIEPKKTDYLKFDKTNNAYRNTTWICRTIDKFKKFINC